MIGQTIINQPIVSQMTIKPIMGQTIIKLTNYKLIVNRKINTKPQGDVKRRK
jgi:hypothetical protein